MRRAILLLATLAAGASGCHSGPRCDVGGTLTLYWQPPQGGFTTATGQLLGCDAAGVATVDVTINGTPAGTFNCHGPSADGIQLTGFGDQTVSIQLDAFDASNRHLYQEVIQNQNTVACGDTLVDATLSALTGDMNVAYALPSGGCMTPVSSPYATTFIWYRLVDGTGSVVSAADQRQNATAIPCSNANPTFVVPALPLGQAYAVDGIEEAELRADGSFVVWSYNCNQSPAVLHSFSGDTVIADPMIAQASGGIAACF